LYIAENQKYGIMARIILLVSLFLSLLTACDKKEDDINPGKDYTGTLTLEYTRTFPSFQKLAITGVNVSGSGQVSITPVNPVPFYGESEKMIGDDRIRIREEGEIVITSPEGLWLMVDGKENLRVDLGCTVTGSQKVWKWTYNNWQLLSEIPLDVANPVQMPMYFRIDNALLSEAVCGSSVTDPWGICCFRWKLVLTPGFPD